MLSFLTLHHVCYQIVQLQIMESTTTNQRSDVYEDTAPVRKQGIGKGLMTVWHAMYSHNVKCQSGPNFIDETGCLRSLRPFDDFDGLENRDNGRKTQVKSHLFDVIW